jgi:hypothetical protein
MCRALSHPPSSCLPPPSSAPMSRLRLFPRCTPQWRLAPPDPANKRCLELYSYIMSSYWAKTGYITIPCPPIWQRRSIFSLAVLLLGRDGVYSHSLSSYWPETECVLKRCPPIGQRRGVLAFVVLLLGRDGEYSHYLSSYPAETELNCERPVDVSSQSESYKIKVQLGFKDLSI